MQEFLVCPICKVPLAQKGKGLCCDNCGLECIDDKGIYDFLGRGGSYWGEISPEEMAKTLQSSRTNGWKAAVRDLSFRYPDMNEYISSNGRIDWLFHCLDLSKTDSCLDIGSGWGTISFGLARYYDEVWSLEAVKERIEFQRIRREQDGTKNVKLVRSDWVRLPFRESKFDLVVANGVLEWVGLSDYYRNPREVQLDFLKEVRRVLKPGGCLYIGTENRFGLDSLRGAKDHSGLPFTSVLPRKLADLIVRLFRKTGAEYNRDKRMTEEWKSYRTYTYSFWEYKKLLREAGFDRSELYWTSAYNSPKHAGRFDDDSFRLSRRLFRKQSAPVTNSCLSPMLVAEHLPSHLVKLVLPIVCPNFLIFAYKERKGISFESALLESIGQVSSFVRVSGSDSIKSKINYFLFHGAKLHSVSKFPRFTESNLQISDEEARMSRFNPLSVERKTIGSITVFTEPPLEGTSCQPYNLSHNQKALNWLLDFQCRTQKGFWNFSQLEEKVTALSNLLSQIPIDVGVKLRTNQRLELFLESLSRVRLPKNAEHGDFSRGNILIGKNGLVYVMDWELYREEGDPLFDFIFFIVGNFVKEESARILWDAFRGRGKYFPVFSFLLSEFSKAKDLSSTLVLQAVPYTILRWIHYTYVEGETHLDFIPYMKLLESWDQICALE